MKPPAWFQSAPPVREATRRLCAGRTRTARFNPRPPCGRRLGWIWLRVSPSWFQSAPPVREATSCPRDSEPPMAVSIRAPRAGGDSTCREASTRWRACFNPRPPCGRRREIRTLPDRANGGFNPRPPCGRRQPKAGGAGPCGAFQSAPPVREATSLSHSPAWICDGFNPRPPCGRRRARQQTPRCIHAPVSIRAPRAGGDVEVWQAVNPGTCFNPRPPCGRRPFRHVGLRGRMWFQSAPPVREATRNRGDPRRRRKRFNPRPPCGRRPPVNGRRAHRHLVSIRAPRAGGDRRAPDCRHRP